MTTYPHPIQSSQAREGMVMCFVNERINYVIEDVSFTRDGKVRITRGNDTAVEFFEADQTIWVKA